LDISFIYQFRVIIVLLSRVFIAEDIDGVRDKRSGNTKMVDIQAFLQSFFEHVPDICLFHF